MALFRLVKTSLDQILVSYMQESTSRIVELHHDNPWMIGRLIQYVYRGHYENKDNDNDAMKRPATHIYTVTFAVHLSDIMASQQAVQSFEEDFKKDGDQSHLRRALEVYNTAEQYQIAGLQKLAADDAISDSLIGISPTTLVSSRSTAPTLGHSNDIIYLTDALDVVGTFRLAKDKYFRRRLAMVAALIPEARTHERIVKWCTNEPDFALLMMECMAEVFTKRELESHDYKYQPSKRRRY